MTSKAISNNVSVLSGYMPTEAAELIAKWIAETSCQFKISGSRKSKFGDYRPPFRGKGHRISVNHDLNPYAFLITTVHEFAHLHTWEEHRNKVQPHGLHWKDNFKKLMQPFFAMDFFPEDIRNAVSLYLSNPGASSCSDLNLFRTLQKYNPIKEDYIVPENIPKNSSFLISSGRVFEKGEKLRKRYRCIEKPSGKVYLFNPLAEVKVLS